MTESQDWSIKDKKKALNKTKLCNFFLTKIRILKYNQKKIVKYWENIRNLLTLLEYLILELKENVKFERQLL